MKSILKFFAVLTIAIFILTGCGIMGKSNSAGNADAQGKNRNGTSDDDSLGDGPDQKSDSSQTQTSPSKEGTDPIKERLDSMTLDEKIGQMVIVGFDGYDMNDRIKQLVEEYHAGGFIFYKANIRDASQLIDLINSMKKANAGNAVPLFFSVDEEGGRISRMPDDFKKFPTNKAIGELNNGDLSFEIGCAIAQEIKAFGFNMDFAPVLDINSNPKNPVIGDRSFGSNAGVVSELGVETMKGIQSEEVISVVKHFPGHGDTSVDSHIGLPRVDNDLERLKGFELVPFAKAIKNGADAVMVAHILLPEIDPEYPATMSKTIITDILKKDMKFDGVVVTDDMTMGAIIENYKIEDAAVKSVEAGSDIVLVCHEFEKETAVIQALKRAVENGTIPEERVNESVYKILKLKQKYGVTDQEGHIGVEDIQRINDDISGILKAFDKL